MLLSLLIKRKNKRSNLSKQIYRKQFHYVLSLSVHGIIILLWILTSLEKYVNTDNLDSIEVDLVYQEQIKKNNTSAKSKLKINPKLLPQLPKKFTITDKLNPKSDDLLNAMPSPDSKRNLEEKLASTMKEKSSEAENSNKLKKEEALRRLMKQLALQRLEKSVPDSQLAGDDTNDDLNNKKENFTKWLKMNSSIGIIEETLKTQLYRKKVTQIIEKNWNFSKIAFASHKLHAYVNISINKGGRVYNIELVKSSGDKVFDKIIIDAIYKSNPLPPPPTSIASKIIKLNFQPVKPSGKKNIVNG